MADDKIELTFEIAGGQGEWLDRMADEYSFIDASKALRVLLDYAIQDADPDLIFADENMRCRYCG